MKKLFMNSMRYLQICRQLGKNKVDSKTYIYAQIDTKNVIKM